MKTLWNRIKKAIFGQEMDCTIIKKVTFQDFKLSLDVLLPFEKPTPEELANLSVKLFKVHKGKKYQKTFICFYLLGMEIDCGAWASVEMNFAFMILRIERGPYEKIWMSRKQN